MIFFLCSLFTYILLMAHKGYFLMLKEEITYRLSIILFLFRLSMDDAIAGVRRVLHLGMGQPPKNTPHVLRQLHLHPRRLLPNSHLQLP